MAVNVRVNVKRGLERTCKQSWPILFQVQLPYCTERENMQNCSQVSWI